MTPEQQRIEIAQACGWTDVEACSCCVNIPRAYEPTKGPHKKHLPDYLNDLNAMHEAENTFGDPQLWLEYESHLARVMGHVGWNWHSTAAQRAEAFLKNLGLWKT